MQFYTVLFGVSRAFGVAAQLIWDRALGARTFNLTSVHAATTNLDYFFFFLQQLLKDQKATLAKRSRRCSLTKIRLYPIDSTLHSPKVNSYI